MAENLPDTNVGNIEYINKQDAFDAVETRIAELMTHPEFRRKHLDIDLSGVIRNISAIPPADVVPVEMLKAEIYKLKCQQDSKNQDYYTGYMSALSTVEGIFAEMDGEE